MGVWGGYVKDNFLFIVGNKLLDFCESAAGAPAKEKEEKETDASVRFSETEVLGRSHVIVTTLSRCNDDSVVIVVACDTR